MSRSALILKFGAIGDVVMALPAVQILHSEGMRIDWVCGQAVLPLLECYSWINPIAVDDRAILQGSSTERAAGLAGLWRLLAGNRYDLCATLY
jgi:heptosyltransferase-2